MTPDTIKELIAEKYKSANESTYYTPETRQEVIKAMDSMLDIVSLTTNITSEELKELCSSEEEYVRNRDAKLRLDFRNLKNELHQRLKDDDWK